MVLPLFSLANNSPKNYFGLQRIVLKTLGISFTGNENFLYRIYSTLWLTSVVLSFSIVEFYEIYVYIDDMDTLVNNLSYLGTDLLGIAKVAVLLYYRLEIGRTLDNIEKGLFAPNKLRGGELEETLIKRCILISNTQTCLYYLAVILVCIFAAIGTMLKRILHSDAPKWETPFTTFSWFETNTSPTYEMVWAYQLWWRALYALIVSSADSLIAGVLAHISTQCLILQNCVRNTILNAQKELNSLDVNVSQVDDSEYPHIPPRILAKKVKENVDYHLAIVDLADQFEELFNILVLIIFVATLFILCFIMYHASLFDPLSIRAAQDFAYVVVICIQVFMYCYWGNQVRLESEKVATACWQVDFVGTDVQFQKSLFLMIRRCQKPIVLTAGKFTTLSLQTYVWIIRLSYSYYMVLRNYNNR